MAFKVDIFRVLRAIDERDFAFYDTLTEEEKASLPMVVILRWFSATTKHSEYHVLAANDVVNRHFWDLSSHPKLQYLLMAACGAGKRMGHKWIDGRKRKTKSAKRPKLFAAFMAANPHMKESDVRMLVAIATADSVREWCWEQGIDEKMEKVLIAEVTG